MYAPETLSNNKFHNLTHFPFGCTYSMFVLLLVRLRGDAKYTKLGYIITLYTMFMTFDRSEEQPPKQYTYIYIYIYIYI